MELKQLILDRPTWLSTDKQFAGERVILSSRLSLSRNLHKLPFPNKASLVEKQQVFEQVISAIEEKDLLGDNTIKVNVQEVSDIGKTLLFERDYLDIPTLRSNGDRGVIASIDGAAIAINSNNHIEIFQNFNHTDMESVWHSLDKIDTILGKELTYAYDEQRGFLLSKTAEAGTGLKVTFTLHLPGLILTDTLEQVLNGASQMGLSAEGKYRHGVDSWGSLFLFTAGAYTGTNEEEILEKSFDVIEEIVKKELEAREQLFEEATMEMEDKVWRAFGILQHARMISVSQLLNLTSAVRLGIERALITTLTLDNLNALISSSLQGSVALLMDNQSKDEDALEIRRAEIIRTILGE